MFSTVVGWIKSIIDKLLLKDSDSKNISKDIPVSDEMKQSIDLWEKMYKGQAPWINDDVKSLNLEADICTEFARLIMLEHKSELTGSTKSEYIYKEYKKVLKELKDSKLELMLATGGLVLKPYVNNKKLCTDIIQVNKFIPLSFNSNGIVTSGIGIAQNTIGKIIHTRLEHHVFNEGLRTHTIYNRCYESDNENELGKEINIKQTIWSDLAPIATIEHVDRPLFVYIKVPLANNIDTESPLGVSIFSRAVDKIKKADIQYGRVDWEYEASEKAVMVDELALRESDGKTPLKNTIDKLKDRMYKTFNTDKNDFYKEYSPEIRDEAYWRGLNRHLERIEFSCQLAYGTLSEPTYSDKTAEEIKTSKQRSFSAVSKLQENLQTALEHLVYIYDVLTSLYKLAPEGKIEQSNEWDDSLIVDSESEQRIRQQEVREGLRTKVSYLMYRYGFTEEQARKELEAIKQEKIEAEKSLFNQQEE